MARDEKKVPEAAGDENGQKKGGSLMGFVVPLVLVMIMAAGAGAALGFMLAPRFGNGETTATRVEGADREARAGKAARKGEGAARNGGHGEAGRDGKAGAPVEEHGAMPQPNPLAALYHGNGELVRLRPVTTNLRQPFRAWVRLEGALIIVRKSGSGTATAGKEAKREEKKDKGKEGESETAVPEGGLAPLIALVEEEVHAYLRTLSLKDLEGAANLAFLRDDLTERAATRTGGLAREFVILSLVVEE